MWPHNESYSWRDASAKYFSKPSISTYLQAFGLSSNLLLLHLNAFLVHVFNSLKTVGFFFDQLETEHEKVFLFDPLYCSAVPTVPGILLEKELAEDECKLLRKLEMRMSWEWPSQQCQLSFQQSRRHPKKMARAVSIGHLMLSMTLAMRWKKSTTCPTFINASTRSTSKTSTSCCSCCSELVIQIFLLRLPGVIYHPQANWQITWLCISGGVS